MRILDITQQWIVKIAQKISFPIPKTSLWKGILAIGTGTVIAQLIGLISTPIITRLYTPSDLGVLALFGSLLAVLVVAVSFRYEFAIPLPRDDSEAANITILCAMFVVAMCAVLLIIMVLLGNRIATFLHYEIVKPYFWLIIIGLISAGTYNILNYWAIRKQDYIRITKTRINQSLSGSISKIVFGLMGFGPLGLICGEILSQITGIGTFLRQIWKNDRSDFQDITRKKIIDSGKKYKKFPFFSLPSSILNVIALQLPIFMLSYMYGLEVVGFYSLAFMVLVFPTSFIATSVAQVYFGEAAKLIHESPEKLKKMYISTTKHLLIFGTPIFLGIAISAPLLFPLIFGDLWKDAGLYCIPLTLMAASSFVISSTSNLGTYGFNHWQFGWDLLRTGCLLFGFYVAFILDFEPIITLFLYGVILTGMYAILYRLNLKSIERIAGVHS